MIQIKNRSGEVLCEGETLEEALGNAPVDKRGRRGLRGADLRDVQWPGIDLSGFDLSCARLNGADLRGSNLAGILAFCTMFDGADMSGANLRGANLGGSYIQMGVKMIGSDLTNARLSGAYICVADFTNANLDGAALDALWWGNVTITGVNRPLPDFPDTVMRGSRLRHKRCDELMQRQVAAGLMAPEEEVRHENT